MLRSYDPPPVSPLDRAVFDSLVRRDHWVRRADEHIDFVALRESIAEYYSTDVGCPGIEPVLLIKLELMMYHDQLSDSPGDSGERWV